MQYVIKGSMTMWHLDYSDPGLFGTKADYSTPGLFGPLHIIQDHSRECFVNIRNLKKYIK